MCEIQVSSNEIADIFGFDHATILHGKKWVQDQIDSYGLGFNKDFETIHKLLTNE